MGPVSEVDATDDGWTANAAESRVRGEEEWEGALRGRGGPLSGEPPGPRPGQQIFALHRWLKKVE